MNSYDGSTDYDTFKTKLGLDSDYMIRFNDPFSNLGNTSLNKAAVVNTQIAIMKSIISEIGSFTGSDAEKALASQIISRTGDETSLGDTTWTKNAITTLSNSNDAFSPSSEPVSYTHLRAHET